MKTESIDQWIIAELKEGNELAVDVLWERYYPRLTELARRRLPHGVRRVQDEEDVALSVLESFCRAIQRKQFPDLADSKALWRLLFQMTVFKVIDRIRRSSAQKSGRGKVRGDSIVGEAGFDAIADNGESPDVWVALQEEYELMLADLDRDDVKKPPKLRTLAIAKLDGLTNQEIAERFGCSLRTVERRLEMIRKRWEALA